MVLDQFLILKESSLDNISETVYTLIGSTVLFIESKRTTVKLICFVAVDFCLLWLLCNIGHTPVVRRVMFVC